LNNTDNLCESSSEIRAFVSFPSKLNLSDSASWENRLRSKCCSRKKNACVHKDETIHFHRTLHYDVIPLISRKMISWRPSGKMMCPSRWQGFDDQHNSRTTKMTSDVYVCYCFPIWFQQDDCSNGTPDMAGQPLAQ